MEIRIYCHIKIVIKKASYMELMELVEHFSFGVAVKDAKEEIEASGYSCT